jgi:hypothetical protein
MARADQFLDHGRADVSGGASNKYAHEQAFWVCGLRGAIAPEPGKSAAARMHLGFR